jgi:hypothetical protein
MKPGYCPGGEKPIQTKKRSIVRCPECNKRLLLAEVHCIGGELTCMKIPEHKPKEKTKHKRPKGDRGARRV